MQVFMCQPVLSQLSSDLSLSGAYTYIFVLWTAVFISFVPWGTSIETWKKLFANCELIYSMHIYLWRKGIQVDEIQLYTYLFWVSVASLFYLILLLFNLDNCTIVNDTCHMYWEGNLSPPVNSYIYYLTVKVLSYVMLTFLRPTCSFIPRSSTTAIVIRYWYSDIPKGIRP